jgi:Retroviral aspartyl protease
VDPTILHGQLFQIEVTKPLVIRVENGERIVTDTHCATLNFSLQGHVFTGDLRLLQIQGYDVILGLNWLSQFSTMLVNWNEKWVELGKQGNVVKLQVQKELATIHLCESIELEKEAKEGSEFMVAQIWLCMAEEQGMDMNHIPTELHPTLLQFAASLRTKP